MVIHLPFLQIPGLVNVDFADVRAIMANAGSSLMGIGTATGIVKKPLTSLACWYCCLFDVFAACWMNSEFLCLDASCLYSPLLLLLFLSPSFWYYFLKAHMVLLLGSLEAISPFIPILF